MKVGLIGWRGMVGSVLMQRMKAERDLDCIEPHFFSTSAAGGESPMGDRLRDAYSIDQLAAMDTLVSCQGGDYTNQVFPMLRAAGWNGYWIDAASSLRMKDDCRHHPRSTQSTRNRSSTSRWYQNLRRR